MHTESRNKKVILNTLLGEEHRFILAIKKKSTFAISIELTETQGSVVQRKSDLGGSFLFCFVF